MNCSELNVLLSPFEYESLPAINLSQTSCVVFDVLRATSTMTVALANGAKEILPCEKIEEAIAAREADPELILAGEREGKRITSQLSHSFDFDLGNSPREMKHEAVFGKRIATTTTNGTRAIKACKGAQQVLIGSFLNMSALKQKILDTNPDRLLLVCAGTAEKTALEDTLGAGALCDLLWPKLEKVATDSARLAWDIYHKNHMQLLETASKAKNARHLLSIPELAQDVEFCMQRDTHPVIGSMNTEGSITI
jgi:2-phosphosulfolactate phosphatase